MDKTNKTLDHINYTCKPYHPSEINRYDFGRDFAFGSATSAYQIEGAWNVGGKGMSIWDFYTLKNPGLVEDGSNGSVAIDHYNMFKEDVALMRKQVSIHTDFQFPGLGFCQEEDCVMACVKKELSSIMILSTNSWLQAPQNGEIGMSNVAVWYEPLNHCPEDEIAASRALDFLLGWFVEPIVTGHYPQSMIKYVGCRLPHFTEEEVQLVRGSYDFLGVNYYTSNYATNKVGESSPESYINDSHVTTSPTRNGIPIGDLSSGTVWLYNYPLGIYNLLMKMKKLYGGNKPREPVIYITENGSTDKNDKTLSISNCLLDNARINYHKAHLHNIKRAMNDGVNVKGYFIWSLFDNFEWGSGFNVRFGIFYVDFVNGNFTRFPKNSAIWWMNFLEPSLPKPPFGRPPPPFKEQPYGPGPLKLLMERPEETPENGQGSPKRLRSS